jgi:nickel/cobalt transporter (NicO) family protein
MMELLFELQQWIYAILRDRLYVLADDRDWLSMATILPLGAVFGALHALTPGHNKIVLATYLMGSRSSIWQGVGVAGMLASTHVGTAVVLALVGMSLITRTIVGAGRAPALEDISSTLLLGLGVWLLIRALKQHAHGTREGLAMGVFAGLIPCPLTLVVMFASIQRGVPEIGVLFAGAMLAGVMLTLGGVALAAVVGRQHLVLWVGRYGGSVGGVTRLLEGGAGMLITAIALQALFGVWR